MRRLFASFFVLFILVATPAFSQVSSTDSKTIIAQLKEAYPNKVIYIDVWATWCGPCINQFRYAETLKKDTPKDVIFVYVCTNSEQKEFETIVKKYKLLGVHYFLTVNQYRQFDDEVNITGFPTYMIITKEGKLLKEGVHRPSSGPLLVNQLKELTSR